MEKPWKITLSDGTQIKNLELSGNNFISETKVTSEMFEGKLSKVIVEGQENGQPVKNEYGQMELILIDDNHFALRELSQDEIDKLKMQGDIEYLAMMTETNMDV